MGYGKCLAAARTAIFWPTIRPGEGGMLALQNGQFSGSALMRDESSCQEGGHWYCPAARLAVQGSASMQFVVVLQILLGEQVEAQSAQRLRGGFVILDGCQADLPSGPIMRG